MGHFLTFLYNVMLATSSITFAPADVELNVIGEPIVITEQNKSDFELIQPNILYVVKDGDTRNNSKWEWDGTYRATIGGLDIKTKQIQKVDFSMVEIFGEVKTFHQYWGA